MKPTIAQFLNIKDFPFIIKDKNDNIIYYEESNGFWNKREYNYNARGNIIYFYYEDSNRFWSKFEYDDNGKEIYYETSNGYWSKREYDAQGDQIYFENSDGTVIDNRSKTVVEMTLQQVADKLGVDVKTIRIKD